MGKRANGEGSLFKRSDGRWCATIIEPSGRRRYLYGKTRQDVKGKLHTAQENVKKALPVVTSSETLAHFLERWLRDVAPNRLRPATLERYRGDVRLHILPALGRLRLAEVTPPAVQAFVNGLDAGGLSPASIRHARAVLRVALQHALREGSIGQNSAKLVDTPRAARKPVAALAPEDARALLATFAGHSLEELVITALATGLRMGELLGLTWEDADLDAGTLRIRRQLQRLDGAFRLVDLKTENSRRALSLPLIAVEALRRQRAHQAEMRLYAGSGWQDLGLVFTTDIGGYLNGSSVTHRFQKQLAAAGLPSMTWHHLRHGAASLLLAQGASMRVVMEQLGHSQIALTMNTYAHITPALLQDAADKLNRALGGETAAG